MQRFDTVKEYNDFNNHETLHPLVSVIDYSKADPRILTKTYYGLYMVILKDVVCGDIRYGKNTYDYQEGTLIFIAPGQILENTSSKELYQPKGHGVIFHPDLLPGTSLGKLINGYNFFSYNVNEALHISLRERQTIINCFDEISYELEHAVDKHSKKLIASNIELLLNYCERFYDRQFITRENENKGIIGQFEEKLNEYFSLNKSNTMGIPSVTYFADEFYLSPNYFGDLIKKETGKSAKEFILNKIIDVAKNKIFEPNKTVSEIAGELGFKYPQHFSRMFKKETGYTPNEYRNLN